MEIVWPIYIAIFFISLNFGRHVPGKSREDIHQHAGISVSEDASALKRKGPVEGNSPVKPLVCADATTSVS